MRQWQCPWCGATRRQEFTACPDSCGWTQTAHPAALAAVAVGGDHFAATGSNAARARESLGMALRAAGREADLAAGATMIDAPDVAPGRSTAKTVRTSTSPGPAPTSSTSWTCGTASSSTG